MPKNPNRERGMIHHNNIRFLMERDGVRQVDIARAWGVQDGDVTQRIKGQVSITPERARVLGVKFGWTFSEIYEDPSALKELSEVIRAGRKYQRLEEHFKRTFDSFPDSKDEK